eukprot:841400-Rhodomonas_salina.1
MVIRAYPVLTQGMVLHSTAQHACYWTGTDVAYGATQYDVARLLLDSYKHQKDALMALGGYALVTEEGG